MLSNYCVIDTNSHNNAITHFVLLESRTFGIDWSGPLPTDEETSEVEVPQTFCPLNDEDEAELTRTVSPSAQSNNYGIDLYLATLSFVQHKVYSTL